jgi:predicted alpha-1,2-mannosidase
MGGPSAFTAKLDSLFIHQTSDTTRNIDDIHGRIGEYWHGNEPSHHIVFLYDYAGQPWKTQKLVREVMRTQYGNQPNSLCGNDDCGQMSAWYIFNTLGFYPVCPGSDEYAIGAPMTKHVTVHLSNGRTFTVDAPNLSENNMYVQSVTLNGKTWEKPFLPYDQLKTGGSLKFVMGTTPNRTWGMGAGKER